MKHYHYCFNLPQLYSFVYATKGVLQDSGFITLFDSRAELKKNQKGATVS